MTAAHGRSEDADDGRSAFTDHYARAAPALAVWAMLRIRPQVRAYCAVEDLLQEVWCRAYAIRDRFDPQRVRFRIWLFRVAKNVLLEVVRKARYAGRVAHPEGRTSRVLQLEGVADDVTSITRRVARDETLQRFRERVDALRCEDRELVVHIGIEGLEYREAATQLGLDYETLKKRWLRLRARLEADGLPETLLDGGREVRESGDT